MESVIRSVNDIEPHERRLYESLLGRELKENQQVVIRVVTLADEPAVSQAGPFHAGQPSLPDYCNVYDGLSNEEIAEIETLILDRGPSRPAS